jgi:hypothetical protein
LTCPSPEAVIILGGVRSCGRTFNSLTGTPLAHLRHKAKWIAFSQCMLASRTVRNAAVAVEVDKNTGHRWRHRLLTAKRTDRAACLTGIAEADETFLPESQKAHASWTVRRANAVTRRKGAGSRRNRSAF